MAYGSLKVDSIVSSTQTINIDDLAKKTGQAFTGDVTLNAQSDLRFADSDSSHWVAFQAPASIASNVTWTLPSADGSANQVLITNGSGTLSWTTISAGLSLSDDTSTNATRYITFGSSTSGTLSSANVSSTKLYFNPNTGTLSATVFTSLSDASQKKDVKILKDPISVVSKLRGVSFKWKDNDEKSIGLIAQEVEKIIPEAVSTNEDGIKSLNYGSLVGLLIEAIKEQQIQIARLEEKLNA